MYHRLSLLYMTLGFTAFGYVMVKYYYEDWDEHYKKQKERGEELMPSYLYYSTKHVNK